MNLRLAMAGTIAVAAALVAGTQVLRAEPKEDGKAAAAPKPALSVSTTRPQTGTWPVTVPGTGSLAAWQEAIVGAELSGLRLTEVTVNVGDVVRRGQILALLQQDAVRADLTSSQAALQETVAAAAEARANAERARALRPSDAVSAQEAERAFTAEKTAQARVEAARARVASDELRLSQTRVLAPDAGIISARVATVGSVVPAGQELFRLIRQQRLEWRAEVPAPDLARVKPGMTATLTTPSGQTLTGKVRVVAPTVDVGTRNGLVYVDLPVAPAAQAGARAGMFASGRFEVGQAQGLMLPQSAILLRDGFSYVFVVKPDHKVSQVKVQVGRRVGERVEVLGGVDAQSTVVASGAGFLADGDTVRVLGSRP